jgi:hypothetical protein
VVEVECSRDRAPQSRAAFDQYARKWIMAYQGRTRRGFDEDTRQAYPAALEAHAIPISARVRCATST